MLDDAYIAETDSPKRRIYIYENPPPLCGAYFIVEAQNEKGEWRTIIKELAERLEEMSFYLELHNITVREFVGKKYGKKMIICGESIIVK